MQKTKGGGMQPETTDRNDKYRAVASDLAAVIDHVRRSLELIETEIAIETAPEEAVDNIFVLDDVTPAYVRARAVLRECDAGLSAALRILQQSIPSGDLCRESVAAGSLPRPH